MGEIRHESDFSVEISYRLCATFVALLRFGRDCFLEPVTARVFLARLDFNAAA